MRSHLFRNLCARVRQQRQHRHRLTRSPRTRGAPTRAPPPVVAGGCAARAALAPQVIRRDQCPTPSQRAARASVTRAQHQVTRTCISAPSWRNTPGIAPEVCPQHSRAESEPALRTADAEARRCLGAGGRLRGSGQRGRGRGGGCCPVSARKLAAGRAPFIVSSAVHVVAVAAPSPSAAAMRQTGSEHTTAQSRGACCGIDPATDKEKLWGASQTTTTSAIE